MTPDETDIIPSQRATNYSLEGISQKHNYHELRHVEAYLEIKAAKSKTNTAFGILSLSEYQLLSEFVPQFVSGKYVKYQINRIQQTLLK